MVYYTGVGGITEKGAKGAFVGVANSSGTSVWEQAIPGYANFRGQVFSHPVQPLIMLLNVVDEDLLVAKDWNTTDVNRIATTQIYGRPGAPPTIKGSVGPGVHISSDGKWLCFTRSLNGRSDVCVSRIDNNHTTPESDVETGLPEGFDSGPLF